MFARDADGVLRYLSTSGLGFLGEPKHMKLVDVLLATYNGGSYLQDQLQSLLDQTYFNFRVWVHDDGSSDGTLDVIRAMRPRFGGRLVLIEDTRVFGCASANFGYLMSHSNADGKAEWIAFCDQDDVWLPSKLAVLVNAMEAVQKRAPGKPCLVFSDLCVVDSKLNVLHPSFWAYERINPTNCTLKYLLNRNVVTGCAMLVNRQLLEIASPVPAAAVMHDWWCALLATSGQIEHIPQSLVLYRQHASNRIGARSRGPVAKALRLLTDGTRILERVRCLGHDTYRQANELRSRFLLRQLPTDALNTYLLARDGGLVHRFKHWREFCTDLSTDNLFRLLFWNRNL